MDRTPQSLGAEPVDPAKPARILVVEDEAVVALDVQGRLRRLGYQVVGTAASYASAISQAAELRPDLVLMDIALRDGPDGRSEEYTSELQSLRHLVCRLLLEK